MNVMARIADGLSCLRIALAPLLLALAWAGARAAFVACLVIALLSDALDGRIARWSGRPSERGAVLDSWGDLLTYTILPAAACWLRPEFVRAEAAWLAVAVASFVAPTAIGFLKYRRLTSYHTLGAKLAAHLVGASAVIVFAGGSALPFRLATAVLVLVEIEEIAITAVLPEWRPNVRSFRHALALRSA